MYYIDLFSGIGGFALGAYWAGWRFDEHYFSEIDPYCVELYTQRFPEARSLGDITKIDIKTLSNLIGQIGILTGGFPCQDISIAGKGKGIEGARSGLWFEMWRIIRVLRPRFAIIENVGAITHRGLDTVLGCLAEIGYDAEWQDIRASDVGAPHKRERIWIVAYPGDDTNRADGRTTRETPEISRKHRTTRCSGMFGGTNKDSKNVADAQHPRGRTLSNGINKDWQKKNEVQTGQSFNRISGSSQDVADTTIMGCTEGAVERGEISEEARGTELNIRNKTPRSHPGNWLTEPDVGRLASGVPHRVDRLKALGNSIVPQIAELLFRRIGEVMNMELT